MKPTLSTFVVLIILACLAVVFVCHAAQWNTSTVFASAAIGFIGSFAILAGLAAINSFNRGYPVWLNVLGALLITLVALFVYSQMIDQLRWNPLVAWGWLIVGTIASICSLLYTMHSATA